jgi:hypothetical protein
MADPNWADVIGVVGGLVGAVGGTVGAVGGILAARANRVAARAEQHTSELAASSLHLDLERRHEDLSPPAPASIVGQSEEHPRLGGGYANLFGSVTVPRPYRVRIEALTGDSSRPLHVSLVLRERVEHRFEIEQMPPDRRRPQAQVVRFRFWPPIEADDVVPWTCPCGRPVEMGSGTGPGHWEWRVPLEYYDVLESVY